MRHGFSLIELSIVLVILGLLTGGILAGQSLIRASELRAVTTEYQRYIAAVQSFRDKYMALPGDMTNATKFWGVQHATPATCKTTASTTALTCDGDGDGYIGTAAVGSNEISRAWQQLANAGLIEGTYTGVQYAALVYSAQGGVNVPSGKMANSAWFMNGSSTPYSGSAWWFDGKYGNRLSFGSNQANGEPADILSPDEMWSIDTKLDDGRPAKGRLWAGNWDVCTTAASSADLTASYDLSLTTRACEPAFVSAF